MRALLFCGAVAALCAPAFALPVLDVTETDNGDGSFTYYVDISTQEEVSFLDLTISGNLHRMQGFGPYVDIGPPWRPNMVFTSDETLFMALNPTILFILPLPNTVVDDTHWPGKVLVELTPNNGDEFDGTEQVHVALTSFTGGLGGPLPGGNIPLARIQTWGRNLWIHGKLQSDSDPDGHFEWHIPEPSTLLLAGMAGLFVLLLGRRQDI